MRVSTVIEEPWVRVEQSSETLLEEQSRSFRPKNVQSSWIQQVVALVRDADVWPIEPGVRRESRIHCTKIMWSVSRIDQ